MGKMFMCRAKGNPRIFKSRLHQFISTENSIVSQEPGLVQINSIIKNKQIQYISCIHYELYKQDNQDQERQCYGKD